MQRAGVVTVLTLAAAASLGALPAQAVDEQASAAIRQTIESQIEAFRRDDALAAYGLAAPGIQRMFPSSDVFMQMVRNGYAPVYRPRSFAFANTREIGGTIAQEVRLVDSEGTNWLALYTMERQEDGSWKISGCTLVKAPDQSV